MRQNSDLRKTASSHEAKVGTPLIMSLLTLTMALHLGAAFWSFQSFYLIHYHFAYLIPL